MLKKIRNMLQEQNNGGGARWHLCLRMERTSDRIFRKIIELEIEK
jgi:hypothetical protein